MLTNLEEFMTSPGTLFISKVMIASIQAQLKAVSTVFRRPELPFRQLSVVFLAISLACILLRVLAEAGGSLPREVVGEESDYHLEVSSSMLPYVPLQSKPEALLWGKLTVSDWYSCHDGTDRGINSGKSAVVVWKNLP